MGARTGLTNFCTLALQPSASTMQPKPRASALWPVPPPRWRWTACRKLGPSRRARKRRQKLVHRTVQLIVSALNWETLGHVSVPPPEACVGFPISPDQHLILEHIEDMVLHHLDMGDFAPEELGRFTGKYQALIRDVMELPHCKMLDEDLTGLLIQLHSDMDPYASHFSRTTTCKQDVPDHQCSFEGHQVASSATGAKEVVSSRIKWDNPPSFSASPFLSNELVRAAFEDPECLRLPKSLWPKSRVAKLHCTKRELLNLASRWDELGALTLMPASEKNMDEAVGIFAVPKDQDHDRLIINPQKINSRMLSISDFTKSLAPGSMLSLLSLNPHEVFRFSADDLTDYYYTFAVSEARARRNSFRMRFRPEELQHLRCYKPEYADSGDLLLCLSVLAMGDSLAVEVAQQAHHNVLKMLCGAMLSTETVRYRFPIPRTPFVELLAIDDHVGIQKLPLVDLADAPTLRDTQVFEHAERAYQQVGLVQHPRKRRRNLTQGTILGADFDGVKGRVMAPRSRIALLSLISLAVVRAGTCTRHTLQMIVGCWVHVLLFRRVLFSIIDALFSEGISKPAHETFCLSRQARNELQLLAILGPTAQSDLRAQFCSHLFTTDASPSGGAVCRAEIGPETCKEIWRHTEQKGFYTRLQSPVSQILAEHGIEPISNQVFQDTLASSIEPSSIPFPLSEGFVYDAIELFRGTGNWSEAYQRHGLLVHDGIDLDGRRLRVGDLAKIATCQELCALALRRVVRDWHAGVPCPSFGTLRRPQVRSKREPFGFNPSDEYTAYHNMLAQRTALILTLALKGGAYVSVEQPRSSRLFLLHCYQTLVRLGCIITHFSFCSFGSAFQKPSKWLHNKPWLETLHCKCTCGPQHKHFVVQGTFTHQSVQQFDELCTPNATQVYGRKPVAGERVSSYSAAYPLRLVDAMAAGAARSKAESPGRPSDVAVQRTLAELDMAPSELLVPLVPEVPYPARPWHEDPEWITELCESLHFREVFRFTFTKPGHINVNETRTYKSWLKSMAKSHRDSRFIGILDSRVTLGAAAKGRSSSFAISRVLQGSIGYVIGGNLYPGGLHCYSKHNRADEPSRGKPVRGPTKAEPAWLSDLRKGKHEKFDAIIASSRVSKNPARWIRFLLLLAGDIERNPGPSVKAPKPRGAMDLTVGFSQQTSTRMTRCLGVFRNWVVHEGGFDWEEVISTTQGLAYALRAYGLFLFERGYPRYMLVYAITAVQDVFPETRTHLGLAWQVDKKWQHHEPGACRAVLPAVAIRAAVAIAGSCLVLVGFAGMLHPSEIIALVRQDLIFPSDLGGDMACMFVHLQNPKTARFARRQHCRIDDSNIIALVERVFGHYGMKQRLYSGSMSQFRRQWDSVMRRLGIPCRQHLRGATPGTLRGSGATYLYTCTQDVPLIAWKGRWARTKTLEFYLQEVAAQLLLHELAPASKALILELSSVSWAILCTICGLAVQE
eukprot:Skav209170  [mRNA]  locus=scaffold1137:401715:406094:- [translate_table: standard]